MATRAHSALNESIDMNKKKKAGANVTYIQRIKPYSRRGNQEWKSRKMSIQICETENSMVRTKETRPTDTGRRNAGKDMNKI